MDANNWEKHHCKSGEVLFYYNPVTKEHKWANDFHTQGSPSGSGNVLVNTAAQSTESAFHSFSSMECTNGVTDSPLESCQHKDDFIEGEEVTASASSALHKEGTEIGNSTDKSNDSDSTWYAYKCKSGETLFYYNTNTGEHRLTLNTTLEATCKRTATGLPDARCRGRVETGTGEDTQLPNCLPVVGSVVCLDVERSDERLTREMLGETISTSLRNIATTTITTTSHPENRENTATSLYNNITTTTPSGNTITTIRETTTPSSNAKPITTSFSNTKTTITRPENRENTATSLYNNITTTTPSGNTITTIRETTTPSSNAKPITTSFSNTKTTITRPENIESTAHTLHINGTTTAPSDKTKAMVTRSKQVLGGIPSVVAEPSNTCTSNERKANESIGDCPNPLQLLTSLLQKKDQESSHGVSPLRRTPKLRQNLNVNDTLGSFTSDEESGTDDDSCSNFSDEMSSLDCEIYSSDEDQSDNDKKKATKPKSFLSGDVSCIRDLRGSAAPYKDLDHIRCKGGPDVIDIGPTSACHDANRNGVQSMCCGNDQAKASQECSATRLKDGLSPGQRKVLPEINVTARQRESQAMLSNQDLCTAVSNVLVTSTGQSFHHIGNSAALSPIGVNQHLSSFQTESGIINPRNGILQTEGEHRVGNLEMSTNSETECKLCNKQFTSSAYLEHFRLEHSYQRLRRCLKCDMNFKDLKAFDVHQQVHSGEKPFKCGECRLNYKSHEELRKHLRMHVLKPYNCFDCRLAFGEFSQLHTHLDLFHPVSTISAAGIVPFRRTELNLNNTHPNIATAVTVQDEDFMVLEGSRNRAKERASVTNCVITVQESKDTESTPYPPTQRKHYQSKGNNQSTQLDTPPSHSLKMEVSQSSQPASNLPVQSNDRLPDDRQTMLPSNKGVTENIHQYQTCTQEVNHPEEASEQLHTKCRQKQNNKIECLHCGQKFITSDYFEHYILTHSRAKTSQCPMCKIQFKKLKDFNSHLSVHWGERPFRCGVCSGAFSLHKDLMRHLRWHTGLKPYKCSKCDFSFPDFIEFKTHLEVHLQTEKDLAAKQELANQSISTASAASTNSDQTMEQPKANPLPKCTEGGNKQFTTQEYFEHCLRVHCREKIFKCQKCLKQFVVAKDLTTHLQAHSQEKPFKCDKCGIGYSSYNQLRRHFPFHEGLTPFRCQTCDISFAHHYLFKYHVLATHSDEKEIQDVAQAEKRLGTFARRAPKPKARYQCQHCSETFLKRRQFQNHVKIHPGLKPYKCQECDKAYKQQKTLREHKRLHTGEKPYSCLICGKAFRTSKAKKIHCVIHTNQKPYKCKQCDRSFAQESSLIRHRRTHTGEKRHKCKVCHKSFTQSCSLARHELIHEGTRFQCLKCSQSFTQSFYLKKHTRVKHSGKASS